MPQEFPFVKIRAKDAWIFGKRDEETRVYRREGNRNQIADWFDMVIKVAGPAVSPGGVCMYAHVSRAAVYKAINEGRLTAFGFHVMTETRSIFGFRKRIRELPYVYVPVSEAKAWGEILDEKEKDKTLTAEDDPGWVDNRTYYKLANGVALGKYPKKKSGKK